PSHSQIPMLENANHFVSMFQKFNPLNFLKENFDKKLTNQYFKNDLDATLENSLEKMNKKPEEKQ
ncbi:hypothetical protein QCD71_24760, partial [Sphingomonas sp. PsM26]|nr:hypothetical protein [Sphingomonas sp. PsM26]